MRPTRHRMNLWGLRPVHGHGAGTRFGQYAHNRGSRMDSEEQGHGQGTHGFGQHQADQNDRSITLVPTTAQAELLLRAARGTDMSLEQYILSAACVAAEEFLLQQRAELAARNDDQDVDFNEWLSRTSIGRYVSDWGATG